MKFLKYADEELIENVKKWNKKVNKLVEERNKQALELIELGVPNLLLLDMQTLGESDG